MGFKFFIPNYDDSVIKNATTKNSSSIIPNNSTNNFRSQLSYNPENELKIESFDNPINDLRRQLTNNLKVDNLKLELFGKQINDLKKQLKEEKINNKILEDTINHYQNINTQLTQKNKKMKIKYENDIKIMLIILKL